MGEPLKTPRTPTLDFHNIFWMPKTAPLKEIGKVYKSLLTKKHSDKGSRKEKNSKVKLGLVYGIFSVECVHVSIMKFFLGINWV